MSNTSPKPYSRKDTVVILGCLLAVWAIVEFWLPRASADGLLGYTLHVSLGILGMGLVFLALSLYGVARFSMPRQRWLVLGLVALPAVYAGLLAGSLRGGAERNMMASFADGVRSQDGLAALWWGKQSALDLPAWSRGGEEPWLTVTGSMLVSTREDRVEVMLANEPASARECQRILSELIEQKPVLDRMEGWVSVDGKRVGGDMETACRNGGIMSLVAKLPVEE